MVTATTLLTSPLTCVKGKVKVTSIFDNDFDKGERNSKALIHLTSSLTRVKGEVKVVNNLTSPLPRSKE